MTQLRIPLFIPLVAAVIVGAIVLYSAYAAVKPNPDDALPVWSGTRMDYGEYTLQAGAIYADPLYVVGRKIPPNPDGSSSHTWHLRLEGGLRVNKIEFGGEQDIHLGEASVGTLLSISGNDTGDEINTTALIFDGGEFPKFEVEDSEFYSVKLGTGDVAGLSVAGLISATVDDVAVSTSRTAANASIHGKTVDKIIIEIVGNGDVEVGEMRFSNLHGGFDGTVLVKDVDAGTFELTGGFQIGTGDPSACSFCFKSSNTYTMIHQQAGFTDDKPVHVR